MSKKKVSKTAPKLPINEGHFWQSIYGDYDREEAIRDAMEKCRVDYEAAAAILDARTEFFAAMKMDLPYQLPNAPTYAQLRELTAEFLDDEMVEAGILHFPTLGDYIEMRTRVSTRAISQVLLSDAKYIKCSSGWGRSLDLADWFEPQLRASQMVLDELKRTLASIE